MTLNLQNTVVVMVILFQEHHSCYRYFLPHAWGKYGIWRAAEQCLSGINFQVVKENLCLLVKLKIVEISKNILRMHF